MRQSTTVLNGIWMDWNDKIRESIEPGPFLTYQCIIPGHGYTLYIDKQHTSNTKLQENIPTHGKYSD